VLKLITGTYKGLNFLPTAVQVLHLCQLQQEPGLLLTLLTVVKVCCGMDSADGSSGSKFDTELSSVQTQAVPACAGDLYIPGHFARRGLYSLGLSGTSGANSPLQAPNCIVTPFRHPLVSLHVLWPLVSIHIPGCRG
jgi:hypothetical protein